MQQTAGIAFWDISENAQEKIISEMYRFFENVDCKPMFFDDWVKGLFVLKNEKSIQVVCDVYADPHEYENLLTDLVYHLAENIPNISCAGYYDLANDDWGPEEYPFQITSTGEVHWGAKDDDTGNNINIDAAALFSKLFSELAETDMKQAFDSFAFMYYEGGPFEKAYEEFSVENDSPNLKNLVDIFSALYESCGCPPMVSFIMPMIDQLKWKGISINISEELMNELNK